MVTIHKIILILTMSASRFSSVFTKNPEAIPLSMLIGGGLTGGIYMGFKHLTHNNDVIVNKSKPRQWENKDQYNRIVSREDSVKHLRRKGFYP